MAKAIADYFDEEAAVHDEQFIRQMDIKPFYDAVEHVINQCLPCSNVLVLGCGSGLEVERIRFACDVTGVDISSEMLKMLQQKQLPEGVHLTTVCASFLEWDFGSERYDIVLTCYAMHHFNVKQKLDLYRKIHACLGTGGSFINGDLIAPDLEAEEKAMNEALNIYQQSNQPFASLHVDVPFCWESEKQMLMQAGFTAPQVQQEWTNSKLYRCIK